MISEEIAKQDSLEGSQRIAVLLSFSGAGGVERMVINLLHEFLRLGHAVDLLVIRADSPYLSMIPDGVRLIKLKARHSFTAIPELASYLRENSPYSLLAAKDRAGRAALMARRLARAETRICVRLGTNLSEALKYRSALTRWLRLVNMRRSYAGVDEVIAISQGVKEDVLEITGLPANRCRVICNPVVNEEMLRMAGEPIDHAWLNDKSVPVIMGAGRLSQQKDFATLIRAFDRLTKKREVRLIILGEGALRAELEQQVRDLNLETCVQLPGFQSNPFKWMARASLFVLSSRWEGSGNVLTEALALGVPAMSTDCPSGPAETLGNGKYGSLVAVGDDRAMADEMETLLTKPPPAHLLREAVEDFRAEVSAKRYIEALLPRLDAGRMRADFS